MSSDDFDLAVIGAGMVGMCSALWAAKRGLRVALCDPNPPGSGTSFGPACTIATYACVPINSPSMLRDLPRLLFAKDSPLSFRFSYALRNPRWMLAFLAHCRAERVAHISEQLATMLRLADAGLDPLIAEAGAEDLLVQNDFINVWSTEAGFRGAAGSNALRRAQGVQFEEIGPEQIRALEPALKLPLHRGAWFKGVRHVRDPQALIQRMHDRFEALGGTGLRQAATRVAADDAGVTLHLSDDAELRAARLVLAAGAHSARVTGAGAECLPLATERGYHVSFADHSALLSRPVGWAEGGFYATPMATGLRFAGTVEIDALEAPANPASLAYIRRRAAEMVGPLDGPSSEWLGHRPTLPDSLPVIGPSPQNDRIIHAFGHQHVGLTLGGMTGRIVSDLVLGEVPGMDIAPLSGARF